jgi:hypothetical protein
VPINERITNNLLGWRNDDRKTKAIVGHQKKNKKEEHKQLASHHTKLLEDGLM